MKNTKNQSERSDKPDGDSATFIAETEDSGGQRRQVTVLFADLVGYTPLARKLGEEDTFLFIRRIIREMSEAVHAHRGTVHELTGDGLMAVFGAPTALEDAPLRACAAALDIQSRISAIARITGDEHEFQPQLRIGLHTGPVVIGKVGDDLSMKSAILGDTVNLASRLESAAEPGRVLISSTTQGLVADYVISSPAGERDLKGINCKTKVYWLEGLIAGMSRFDSSLRRGLTPLVGREHELKILESAWQHVQTGRINIVNITGEPGIGKSRLVYEFRNQIVANDVRFFRGLCTTDARSTLFQPFIQIIRCIFSIDERNNGIQVERVLRNGLETLGLPVEKHLFILLSLLGFEVKGVLNRTNRDMIRRHTFDSLKTILFEHSRKSAVVLLLEDLHWIDSASEELLQRIATVRDELSLLILCTYRPEYEPRWVGTESVSRISLAPLSSADMIELVKHRLGAEQLPDVLSNLLLGKSDGNPLFAEEVTRYLIQTGQVHLNGQSITYRSEINSDHPTGVPGTLGDLLMQTLDRLPYESRQLLKVIAVIGTRFTRDLVREVATTDSQVDLHLDLLETGGLILSDESSDRSNFRIKHALIRDILYDSLLSTDRKALHLSVGQAIERLYTGRENEVADLLADHYIHTTQVEKAVKYLVIAGERAYRTYSIPEAAKRYHSAMRLVETNPDSIDYPLVIDLVIDLARLYYFQCDFGKISEIVGNHLHEAEILNDERRLSRCLSELGYAQVFCGQGEAGRQLLMHALVLGEKNDDKSAIAHASVGLCWYYGFCVKSSSQIRSKIHALGNRTFAIGQQLGDFWLAAKGLYTIAAAALIGGNLADAREQAQRLFDYSSGTDHPWPRLMALDILSSCDNFAGDHEEALKKTDECLRLVSDPIAVQMTKARKAAALTGLGRLSEAYEILEELRGNFNEGKVFLFLAVIDPQIGVVQVLNGNIAKGVRLIEESKKCVAAWGFDNVTGIADYFLGQIFYRMAYGGTTPPVGAVMRNIGFLLLNMPRAGRKARHYLETALIGFRGREAYGWSAKALFSMAMLSKTNKNRDEARDRFREARVLAESVKADNLVTQINKELNLLN